MSSQPLKLAVITGEHPFDVPAFAHIFRAMDGVEFYVQSLEDFTFFPEHAARYDVVLFYNMHLLKPGDDQPWFRQKLFSTLADLGKTPQGIVVLHHALLAFPEWPLWSQIVGIKDRKFGYHMRQTVTTHVTRAHPITEGSTDWTMGDETYTMNDASVADGNDILLTVEHPLSMKTLAWTRTFGQSRVFCYQAGHDAEAFGNGNFRRVLHRGVQWAAGRI